MLNTLKTITACSIIVFLMMSATVTQACFDMSGTTIGCDGTYNFFEYCAWYQPMSRCTGTSAGNPYPDAASVNKGLSDAGARIGICTCTIYFVHCCDGAVTQDWGAGTYGYAKAVGDPCDMG
jgi:hypothetical protein